MVELLLVIGVLTAVFVGFNIGGSSTGVAFGPAVGAQLTSKTAAGVLMTLFALLGGWTVGRNVVETMGGQIVAADQFTLTASIIILFFIGAALLLSNLFGVPASTSMTAVGAIAGLGVATESLNWAVMGRIVSWWFVAPVIAFWCGAVIGRYLYPTLHEHVQFEEAEQLFVWENGPRLHPDASLQQLALSATVIVIACYMAFSAGASNVANAVAPLVGGNAVSMNQGILLAVAAMSLGGFTIARRTLDTVGDGITDLPLLAALIVSVVGASIITALSWMGIPASLAISATMCIAGLGWGRASRTVTLKQAAAGKHPVMDASALQAEESKPIGEERERDLPGKQLFNPAMIGRVVTMWVVTPSLSAVLSFLVFLVV